MEIGKYRKYGVLALFLIGIVALSGLVSAVDVQIDSVKLNEDELQANSGGNGINVLNLERGDGDDLEVKVILSGTGTDAAENVEVEVEIKGSEFDKISDTTGVFDVEPNETYVKRLDLDLPQRMDEGSYLLRVRVTDKNSASLEETYDLRVDSTRHDVVIKDVVFSPENSVKQGRALLATVRLKNYGQKDEEGVKVKVAIPELGVAASDYIEELDADKSKTSEELYLRIPNCAAPGDYNARVSVTFGEGDLDADPKDYTITVLDGDVCEVTAAKQAAGSSEGKTVITVGPESQDVVMGEGGVIYPLTVTNTGSAAKTYTVSADAAGLDTKISPSNVVVVDGGDSKSVYVYVSAKEDAAAGEQVFAVSVSAGDDSQDFAFKANVVEGEGSASGLKKGLEIGLVVLVVLLVILGLIIGFNRLKGGEDDEEPEAGQTYY